MLLWIVVQTWSTDVIVDSFTWSTDVIVDSFTWSTDVIVDSFTWNAVYIHCIRILFALSTKFHYMVCPIITLPF
jgi:hypothetical protein